MAERSGGRHEPGKGPLEQLVDLAVFAPIGLLLNLDEVLPQLVEKGQQQVQVARFFGRMAVRTGTEAARRRVGGTRRPSGGSGGPSDAGSAAPGEPAKVVPIRRVEGDAAAPAPAAGPVEAVPAEPAPDASTLGIPDYDVLSASQVVPRLAGLSPEELDAVRRYEAAHRGRKTILAKIAQLQA